MFSVLCLTGQLSRTTGCTWCWGSQRLLVPDKVQKEVSVHVFRTLSLTGIDWLGIGYRLWDADPFNFRRDYFVMEPSSDLGFCQETVCHTFRVGLFDWQAFERFAGTTKSGW